MPAIGEIATKFTLPGIDKGERRDYTLDEFLGRKVVLAFTQGITLPDAPANSVHIEMHLRIYQALMLSSLVSLLRT